jgi:hypothetical protein
MSFGRQTDQQMPRPHCPSRPAGSSFGATDDVPGPAKRVDQRHGAHAVNLLAELAHVYFQYIEAHSASVSQTLSVSRRRLTTSPARRINTARISYFFPGQFDRRTTAHHPATDGVQRQVDDAEHRLAGRVRPSQQGTDARQELVETERLGETVIRTHIQPGHPLLG